MALLHSSIRPSAIHLGCLLLHIFHLFIFNLYNDCSHIEDMHLLFYAHFMIFFSFWGAELRLFPFKMIRWRLVCVICNSNSFHSAIFKLCIMIVHTLKLCTSLFRAHLIIV